MSQQLDMLMDVSLYEHGVQVMVILVQYSDRESAIKYT